MTSRGETSEIRGHRQDEAIAVVVPIVDFPIQLYCRLFLRTPVHAEGVTRLIAPIEINEVVAQARRQDGVRKLAREPRQQVIADLAVISESAIGVSAVD